MSYFSISTFIESGKQSLKNKNYWSALSVALALPSMCSRIMYQDDAYRGTYWYIDKNNHQCWHDKKCYIDFCKEIMRVNQNNSSPKGQYDSWILLILGLQFAEIIYQLRCDIIHAGVANITEDDKGIYLILGENKSSTEFSKYRTINIKDLCDTIFEHVIMWCSNNSVDKFKYTYVFDMENNNDDRILFNRLCEKDRADLLEERFIKENNERFGS